MEASSPVKKDISTLINEMESLENKMKEKEENFESKMNKLKAEYSSEMKRLQSELQEKRRELDIELKFPKLTRASLSYHKPFPFLLYMSWTTQSPDFLCVCP